MARPVVVSNRLQNDDRVRLMRLAPAAGISLAVHVLFVVLFLVFAPATSADSQPPLELRDETPLQALPAEDESPTAHFGSIDPNIYSSEPDLDNNNFLDRIDAMTVHSMVRPDKDLGSGTGDRSPATLPPPIGFGSGLGATVSGNLGNSEAKLGPAGGSPNVRASIDLSQRGSGATREKAVRLNGGTDASQAAVRRGMLWLMRHQSIDGSWRLDGPFPGAGKLDNKTAGTAFGLLPFLGAGKTHKPGTAKEPNEFDKPVEKGLLYLIRIQDKRNGNLGGGMYAHGLATIALCEAYALTQDSMLRRPAQMALHYIVLAQHDAGGWRYQPGEAGDLSVTGWQIMALKSGMMSGLDVPAVALRKAQRFLDMSTAADEGYCYVGSEAPTPTMTAVGLLSRQYLQSWGPQNLRMIRAIDKYLKPIRPESANNVYYSYYATQVMFHFGGESWTRWNAGMRDHLIKTQDGGTNDGSWAPRVGDPWTGQGGRLMATSLNLLTLEIYYRYLPLYQRQAAAQAEMMEKKDG